jgi:hypothetical protein
MDTARQVVQSPKFLLAAAMSYPAQYPAQADVLTGVAGPIRGRVSVFGEGDNS